MVKRAVFEALGGFSTSYSRPGRLGVGFDADFTARVWASGYQAGLACPSALTAFRNGCGGKATASSAARRAERREAAELNEHRFVREYRSGGRPIEARTAHAQQQLTSNATLADSLRSLFPCIKCSALRDADDLYGRSTEVCHAHARW